MANLTPPPHPGETIREDVLDPLGMSVNQLAKVLGHYRNAPERCGAQVPRNYSRHGITAGKVSGDLCRILTRSPTRIRPPHGATVAATRN